MHLARERHPTDRDRVLSPAIQSLLHQLDQVSPIQPAPIDLLTAEELESFVTIDKESPTLKLQTTEEPFEIEE